MTTPRFAHVDTKRENGCYISFVRIVADDDCHELKTRRRVVYVRARADISSVHNGVATLFSIESPGLYGIELGKQGLRDSYLNDVFAEEKAELVAMIDSLKSWQESAT